MKRSVSDVKGHSISKDFTRTYSELYHTVCFHEFLWQNLANFRSRFFFESNFTANWGPYCKIPFSEIHFFFNKTFVFLGYHIDDKLGGYSMI